MPTESGSARISGSWRSRFVVVGAIALLAGAVGWSGSTIFAQPKGVVVSRGFTTVSVVDGEVGSSLNLNTVAEWAFVPVGVNQASGIVTTVDVQEGAEAVQGTVLFSVDLRDVVIARGEVPAFREIGGDTKGADVAQLQAMLTDLGFYQGASDGSAGAQTVAAIKKWQASLGLEKTGTVGLGDVIFVPTLPGRINLDAEIVKRGARLGGGEIVVQSLLSSPSFAVPVSGAQASLMPVGTRVEVSSPDNTTTWGAYVVSQLKDAQSDTIQVHLGTKDASAVCGTQCQLVPASGPSLLSTRIVTAETVEGLVIPSAAVVTTADGRLQVIDANGGTHEVVQIASARGMTVVEGVHKGLHVRVPATEDAP